MIREAPDALQPITAERPTPPRPKMAQVEPGVTCRQEHFKLTFQAAGPIFWKRDRVKWGQEQIYKSLSIVKLNDIAKWGKFANVKMYESLAKFEETFEGY